MKRIKTLLIAAALVVTPCLAQTQGYYKDIFNDGGIKLTSMKRLPVADYLDLSIENFASSRSNYAYKPTHQDTLLQNALFIGSDIDLNGILLYPDGAPRFRVFYSNGGRAAGHGGSLGAEGIARVNEYIANGGSYIGSCAGAFLASVGATKKGVPTIYKTYYGIWPGYTTSTGLIRNYTGMFVEKDSPLLKYYDFGGDHHIDSVRHNGGCYANPDFDFPDKTEVLLRYDYEPEIKGKSIHNKISAWAYKASEHSGRVIAIGSHPESVTSGERLHLMAAFVKYAFDGNGNPVVKGSLVKGKAREMYKATFDKDPDFTMIGDKQYHHFTAEIPKKAKNIVISLEGQDGYDLFLYANKGDFAFKSDAEYFNISLGAKKTITIPVAEAGTWYIGVECNTTVEAVKTEWGYEYTGKVEVLNGVPYSIKIDWE